VWPRLKFVFLNFLIILAVFGIVHTTLIWNWTNLFLSTLAVALASYFLADIALGQVRNVLRAQKRFIADASHELRTPLSIIKADSEIALFDGDQISSVDAVHTLKSNLEEVDRMSKIIDNLLSLSLYDSKVTQIPFAPVNLTDTVGKIVIKAQALAIKKGIRLSTHDNDRITINGNDTAIEQMTMNLIRNAILYTPPGGTVDVQVKKDQDNHAAFVIRDSGIGISAKDLPHIFNPFYKAERPKTSEGSGLGLTIVRRIVDRHHGIIRIDSEIGVGTTVTVLFPELTTA
jgi:signal transduction histidine kinase